MSDAEYLIDGMVVPYSGGRKDTDTDSWRNATDLELEQQKRIEELEAELAEVEVQMEILNGLLNEIAAEIKPAHD